jgi:hypothetical protein
MTKQKSQAVWLALAAAATLAACASSGGGNSAGSSAASPAPTPSAAPAAAPSVPRGMNAKGEVIDPKLIQSGAGQSVKGINDWQGEIVGIPVPGSKFDQLKIGMPMAEVLSIVGSPTDQGSYVTGKAWIPFYMGSDRARTELTFKGKGRLIFSFSSGFSTGQYLTWIIHSANETGYR